MILSFESKIIVDVERSLKKELLVNLFRFNSNENWKLLYRGSRDGFEASDFHKKCDNKPKTLTIVKSTTGCIFGGYTEVEWYQIDPNQGHYKTDNKSFVFSLVNQENKPIQLNIDQNTAIFCDSKCGPVFGEGYFFIKDFSDEILILERSTSIMNQLNTYRERNFYKMYKPNRPKVRFDSRKNCFAVFGPHLFLVAEIEVFQKL